MSDEVTEEDLLAIPAEHRETIALWMQQRAQTFRPSWVCPEQVVLAIRDVLVGASIDLVSPGTDDSTLANAARIQAQLTERRKERHAR